MGGAGIVNADAAGGCPCASTPRQAGVISISPGTGTPRGRQPLSIPPLRPGMVARGRRVGGIAPGRDPLAGGGHGWGGGPGLSPCGNGPGGVTWSASTSLASFARLTDFDCAFQNARWVVHRDSDGVVAAVYAARGATGAKGLSLHLLSPTTKTWSTIQFEPGSLPYARLFGLDTGGEELRNPSIATDGTDFYIAAERATNSNRRIVALRLQWARGRETWSLLGQTVREEYCGLPSVVWDTVGPRLRIAFHANEPGAILRANTNIYLWEIDPTRPVSSRPELVDAADGTPMLPRSKDMASLSASDGRLVLAWRTVQQGAARGAPYKGVMAMTRGPLDRIPWARMPRVTVAGAPAENTNASDPCALALPDGRSLVGYWRNDLTSRFPEIRVSERGSRTLSWTMSGALAPALSPTGVEYHLFAHLEHDDCRVIGVWEGRQDPLNDLTQNGAYVSGSVGSPRWAVPSDAGYFEVPGTGEVALASSLFPGFCTGGGQLHLVWLDAITLTLRYASGVIG